VSSLAVFEGPDMERKGDDKYCCEDEQDGVEDDADVDDIDEPVVDEPEEEASQPGAVEEVQEGSLVEKLREVCPTVDLQEGSSSAEIFCGSSDTPPPIDSQLTLNLAPEKYSTSADGKCGTGTTVEAIVSLG